MNIKKKKILILCLINLSLILYGVMILFVYHFSKKYGFSELVDCPSRHIFGIYCPFCGGTRALSSFLRLDFISSFRYNAALIPSVIAFIFYDIRAFILLLRGKTDFKYVHKTVWIPLMILLIAHWIIKNILLLS